VVVLWPSAVLAQGCVERAVITSGADVYELPPRFVTGVGWQGNRIAALSGNTQVYICKRQTVDFGFSTKVWLQVAFIDKGWRYGWVLEDNIRPWQSRLPGQELESAWSWVAEAFAVDSAAVNATESAPWTLKAAPPPPPPPPLEGVAAQHSVTWRELRTLYGPLFLAMLLGMVAKTLVDYLDGSGDPDTLREHSRNGLVAMLVSPIVFLGFLTAGQFSTSTQTFLVLSLLAFQNGFFWQTVLKRDAGSKSSSDRRGATVSSPVE
jgi:hypothetical protein